MSDGLWLFIVGVIPLIVAVVLAIYEIVRRSDLPLPRKVLWIAFLLVLPPIALALYVVARPPRHRAALAASAAGTERAERMVDLVEQHSLGQLDDASYRSALDDLLDSRTPRVGSGPAQNS